MKVSRRIPAFTVIAALALIVAACSSSAVISGGPAGQGGSSATGGSTKGSGGSSGSLLPTSGASGSVTPDAATGSTEDGGAACPDGGDCVCSSLSVAVVGTPGVYGDSSDTAFQNWLNSNSAGVAKVDNYLKKPAFTPEFLAGYNLIILAGLGDHSEKAPWWTFSDSEIAAFQDWIENKGGGVISLSGYSSDNSEINAKNALLAFTGISYLQNNFSPPCVVEDAQHNKMCYRCNNPYQITEWNQGDPVVKNLGLGVTMIGIDGAYPITAPADAHVAATTTTTTTTGATVNNWLVGKIVGKGRVLVYGDEWITYTNQWSGQASNDASCKGLTPQDLYQTAQFWYNALHWTQPGADCFVIVDQQKPILVW